MRGHSSASTASGIRHALRNQQVDRNAHLPTPRPRVGGRLEAGATHGILEERVVSELSAVDSEVAVLRRLRKGHWGGVGVDIDGLGPDEHQSVAMFRQRVEGVEQHAPRQSEQSASPDGLILLHPLQEDTPPPRVRAQGRRVGQLPPG